MDLLGPNLSSNTTVDQDIASENQKEYVGSPQRLCDMKSYNYRLNHNENINGDADPCRGQECIELWNSVYN